MLRVRARSWDRQEISLHHLVKWSSYRGAGGAIIACSLAAQRLGHGGGGGFALTTACLCYSSARSCVAVAALQRLACTHSPKALNAASARRSDAGRDLLQ